MTISHRERRPIDPKATEPTVPAGRPMTTSGAGILMRVAAGDPDAVQECIDRYGGLVWSLARRLCAKTPEAEDMVQEIFIELWKSASRYDPSRASEATFIATIARRRLIDRLRRHRRRPELRPLPPAPEELSRSLVDEPALSPDAVSRSGPEAIERQTDAALAARELRRLEPAARQALELSIYYGLTHPEIARTLSLPLGTVKSHITRGLAKIRDLLVTGDTRAGAGGQP